MFKRLILPSIIGCGAIFLIAQQGPVSAGSNANGSGGSISYSIGQVDYIINNGSNGSALEGLQQPYEISVSTGIEEEYIRLKVNIFPNPASNRVYLEILEYDPATFKYILLNIEGKQIAENPVKEILTPIPLDRYLPGMYILLLQENNSDKTVKSFKIIKNQ